MTLVTKRKIIAGWELYFIDSWQRVSLQMLILCSFITFFHPLVQDKKPPVVDGVGNENFDPKADQMTRKLINRIGEEEDPHPEAKRILKADDSGKNLCNRYILICLITWRSGPC